MVHQGGEHGGSSDEVDPALRELEQLRREVELQEQRVRLMERRKQQRDELLGQLRCTLARTQPHGFREFSTAAEQILATLNADLPDNATETEKTGDLPNATDAAKDDEGDHVRVVFSASVETQLAAVEEEEISATAAAGATAAGGAPTSVDDFLQDDDDAQEAGEGTKKKKKKSRRHKRGKNQKTADGEQAALHVDPVGSPAGFDFAAAHEVNQRKAQEAEAYKARLFALLDDLVETTGPLPSKDDPSEEPAWLEEQHDVEVAEVETAVPLPDSAQPTQPACGTSAAAAAADSENEEETYPDDFEDEDS